MSDDDIPLVSPAKGAASAPAKGMIRQNARQIGSISPFLMKYDMVSFSAGGAPAPVESAKLVGTMTMLAARRAVSAAVDAYGQPASGSGVPKKGKNDTQAAPSATSQDIAKKAAKVDSRTKKRAEAKARSDAEDRATFLARKDVQPAGECSYYESSCISKTAPSYLCPACENTYHHACSADVDEWEEGTCPCNKNK
jgi:hypothetical protein